MKVKFIKVKEFYRLTTGKIYEVEENGLASYKIINDGGKSRWYDKEDFEIVKEEKL